jgi:pimeloyl-ACP methyl ester carboxylesterase
MEHATIQTNGVNLHVVQAGNPDAPLVILLHGFPDFWHGWRHQIEALAVAGLCVWVPDQRGYNLSDKPPNATDYSLDTLATDVIGLIDAAGHDKCLLVGHDWGGAVAWWTANRFPDRLEKLAIINTPHHSVFRRAIAKNWKQKYRSAYMLTVRIPGLPEWFLARFNWWYLSRALRRSAKPGTFGPEELNHYRVAWSQPGAMTAMLNWYRAIGKTQPERPPQWRITVPTMLVWGAKDKFFVPGLAEQSIEMCDGGRLERIPDGSHWVAVEQPEVVNGHLIEFLV